MRRDQGAELKVLKTTTPLTFAAFLARPVQIGIVKANGHHTCEEEESRDLAGKKRAN